MRVLTSPISPSTALNWSSCFVMSEPIVVSFSSCSEIRFWLVSTSVETSAIFWSSVADSVRTNFLVAQAGPVMRAAKSKNPVR